MENCMYFAPFTILIVQTLNSKFFNVSKFFQGTALVWHISNMFAVTYAFHIVNNKAGKKYCSNINVWGRSQLPIQVPKKLRVLAHFLIL